MKDSTKPILPEPLSRAIETLYKPAGYILTELPCQEEESEEYAAYRLAINGHLEPTAPG